MKGPYAKYTIEWAEPHGHVGQDGYVHCNTTDVRLNVKWVWQTIGDTDDFPFNGLEVKRVGYVYCPRCQPNMVFPEYGSPIALADLIHYQP